MNTAVEERFGPYWGRFVPETLIAALDELSAAWAEAREDERFQSELATLLRQFVGRPTPLYLAERLSDRVRRRSLALPWRVPSRPRFRHSRGSYRHLFRLGGTLDILDGGRWHQSRPE